MPCLFTRQQTVAIFSRNMKTGQNGYGSKPWYEYPSVHTIAGINGGSSPQLPKLNSGALLLCPDLLFSSFSRFLSGGSFLQNLQTATSSKVQSYDGTSTTMEKCSDQNRILSQPNSRHLKV